MAIYFNWKTRNVTSLPIDEAVGNTNLKLIKHKRTEYHSMPLVDYKYLKKDVDSYPIEMTTEEKAVVDSDELENAKKIKITEIEEQEEIIISEGFTFNGTKFASTLSDRVNWNTISALKNDITYPLENTITDFDGNYYTIDKASDLTNLILTGMAEIVGKKAIQKVKKDAVKNATSIDEINNIN